VGVETVVTAAVADHINVPDQKRNFDDIISELGKECAVAFEDNAPPWRNDQLWQAAENTLHYLIYRHSHRLDQVKKAAGSIKNLVASIDLPLDRLCQKTCAQCLASCCLVADVSYDFKDLLFIHLVDQVIPPGQPRQTAHDVCRYLGMEGCLLPRFERPWICTWYICAAQKKFLADHDEIPQTRLLSVIEQVGMLRKQMEVLFINIVAP
jgi:hypothetical protein